LNDYSAKELIQKTGVQKIMFTVRDIMRNVHWSFNLKSETISLLESLSPPEDSYEDTAEDFYDFPQDKQLRKIEFGIYKRENYF
jgi:hypothetical protein